MKLISFHRLAVRAFSGALIASAALLTLTSTVHAQTATQSQPLTCAEVRHQLEELEAAGYDPSRGDDSNYPDDIQEAERKVAAMHAAETNAMTTNTDPSMPTMPMH
ncbi:MAG: hypothetical protein CPDRYMAC_0494 [uncultured Paraburkholderia sp.]|nr:MAG: hypothetical protein CPDRYDRY_0464 [uncultured Paraburkholderia sp.]CAH2912276.1 MAG: hypothetical protein CPDRYMAC_0494 [uncultured Paraburkholderia sp.]